MELLSYLFKSIAILSIFYVVYFIFLKKDTLFKAKRHFFLIGMIAALTLPFLEFTQITYYDQTIANIPTRLQTFSPDITTPIPEITAITAPQATIDWWWIALIIYGAGLAFFLGRLLFQLGSLVHMLRNTTSTKNQGYHFVEINDTISPFSFFKYIVYNPSLHPREELEMILKHEKVHASQLHSIDIISAQVMRALQWMNPFSWLYSKSVEENLEFLADHHTVAQIPSKKQYQLTLVKASSPVIAPALTTQFYQSFIKKRIIMLNKSTSKKHNLWKLSIVLPLLAFFLWSFNVTEEVRYNEPTTNPERLPALIITSETSNAQLDAIEAQLERQTEKFEVALTNRKRNNKNQLVGISIDTRFSGQPSFYKNATYGGDQSKKIPEVLLSVVQDELEFGSPDGELTMRATPSGVVGLKFPKKTPTTSATSMPVVSSPKQIKAVITKTSPPSIFKQLKQDILDEHGVELRFIDQRNEKGEIINLEFYFYENDKEIGTLGLGLYDPKTIETSTFFYSPSRVFNFWNETKEKTLQQTAKEKEHYSKEYLYKMNELVPTKEFKISIHKNTTDTELESLKKLAQKEYGVDLSYTVVRDSNREITTISISYSGDGKSGSYNINDDEPIKEFFFYAKESGDIGFWSEAHEARKKEREIEQIARMDEQKSRMDERRLEMELRREEMAVRREEMQERSQKLQERLEEQAETHRTLARTRTEHRTNSRTNGNYARTSQGNHPTHHHITITKDTTNEELDKLKRDMTANGVSFNYSKVRRNDRGEITGIKVVTSNGKGSKSTISTKTDDDKPIDAIVVEL